MKKIIFCGKKIGTNSFASKRRTVLITIKACFVVNSVTRIGIKSSRCFKKLQNKGKWAGIGQFFLGGDWQYLSLVFWYFKQEFKTILIFNSIILFGTHTYHIFFSQLPSIGMDQCTIHSSPFFHLCYKPLSLSNFMYLSLSFYLSLKYTYLSHFTYLSLTMYTYLSLTPDTNLSLTLYTNLSLTLYTNLSLTLYTNPLTLYSYLSLYIPPIYF